MKLTEEQEIQLYNMAKGIAFKKLHTYRYYGIDAEDMATELFLKSKDYVNKLGRFDLNLLAKAMYNDIVDIIRYNQRRLHTNIDPSQLDYDDEVNDDEVKGSDELNPGSRELSNNATHISDVNDVLNSLGKPDGDFPGPNSTNKEYWYVWLLLKLEVEYDEEVVKRVLDMPENAWMKKPRWQNKWPVDDIIATTLGYAGNHSSSFQKVKNRARSILSEMGF